MPQLPIIEFRDFSFQYYSQAEPTLHDINLRIYPGEKIVIVGPSGSGKSTLGHCINGLAPFSYKGEITGSLKVKGVETREQDIFRLSKLVGTVLQDTDGQFVGLTVGDDIAFVLENDNVAHGEMRARVQRVAQMVGMGEWLTSSPFELSGGQKQRTSLAGVLIDDVEILLFDEPLANLDPATGKTAIEIIDDIHRTTGKTILIIEHRLEDALHRHVDRVIVLNDGRISADMDAHTLVSSPILRETGIREPLYVTALKYAGVPVTPEIRAGYITTLGTDESGTRTSADERGEEAGEEDRDRHVMLSGLTSRSSSRRASSETSVEGEARDSSLGTRRNELSAVDPLRVTEARDSSLGARRSELPSIDPLRVIEDGAVAGRPSSVSFAPALQSWYRSIPAPAPANTRPSILQLEHVTFSYDGVRPVLDDVSFDIREGEMVAIVGKNGAGKSTLSKLLCGFEREDRGLIRYRGANMRDKTIRERAEIIGLVMQNPNQMISKPLIYDEAALGLRLRRVPEAEIAPRVERALKVCGLAPFIKWPISALSYGQKKRVTVASILVLDPKIIILDEPTAGQDYRHYTDIMEFLVEINRLGVTIILITHDMHLMLEYTPRAIVLAGGRKIADTAASVALTDPQVIAEANLKETSLFALAQMAGIADGAGFVQGFIDYEREVKGR
jgi:energy-coupling factor transport system ATP-binding protein